jgi:hypothetical protein
MLFVAERVRRRLQRLAQRAKEGMLTLVQQLLESMQRPRLKPEGMRRVVWLNLSLTVGSGARLGLVVFILLLLIVASTVIWHI